MKNFLVRVWVGETLVAEFWTTQGEAARIRAESEGTAFRVDTGA